MIYSMTGFGRFSKTFPTYTISIEISTVNRKQFDCSINLPRGLLIFDVKLQNVLKKIISRGSIRANITIDSPHISDDATEALAERFNTLRNLAKKLNLIGEFSVQDLLSMPEIANNISCLSPTDELYADIETVMTSAISSLQTMRAHEGNIIIQDLKDRIKKLKTLHEKIKETAKEIPALYQQNLKKRLNDLIPSELTSVDSEALAREIAIFADKCDISEEMTRISAHFVHAQTIFDAEQPCGRALDFLCQELFREINTTGSKCSNAGIAHHVIEFKTLLETFREQVQNLE